MVANNPSIISVAVFGLMLLLSELQPELIEIQSGLDLGSAFIKPWRTGQSMLAAGLDDYLLS
jgi:hypothetical protein